MSKVGQEMGTLTGYPSAPSLGCIASSTRGDWTASGGSLLSIGRPAESNTFLSWKEQETNISACLLMSQNHAKFYHAKMSRFELAKGSDPSNDINLGVKACKGAGNNRLGGSC